MDVQMPQPILITGCGRSGASMIAGVINICGAFGGDMGGTNKHYENIRIHQRLLTPYLYSIHTDPLGQYPVPNTNNITIPHDWAKKTATMIRLDGYQTGPWMVKGATLALTWPIWHYAFPNAKWIIVRRRTGDIIRSCLKTDFMRAFEVEATQAAVGVDNPIDGWRWWVHQYIEKFVEMTMAGLNVRTIWPERMVWGDYQQMFETIDWLGLRWTTQVLEFIDPKLWKVRQNSKHMNNVVEVGDE
jgi:hypothetical protein